MEAIVAWGLLLAAAAAAAAAAAGEFRLTLLHTNDMHSHYDETCGDADRDNDGSCSPGTGLGGFARLRSALDAQRARAAADGAPAVYLVAGDTFHGTAFYDQFLWEAAADFLGDLGANATCLGNHEFNDGPEVLALFSNSPNMSSTPILCANIITKEEPNLTNIRPSTVLTVNNRTVGIIGYLTPDTKYTDKLGKVEITDELESIRNEVAKLKNSSVEFIIALGHSGLAKDRQVARYVDGVDAVVGGHSHTYLYSGDKQDTETPFGTYPIIEKRGEQIVPVVQAYAFAKYLGKLVLTFNSENRLISAVGAPILLDHSIPQDVNTLNKVKYYKSKMKYELKFVGKTKVFLDGNCSCSETNLANMIVDSFISFNLNQLLEKNVTLKGWTDAAVAITISSGIKSSIDAIQSQGSIYETNILRVLPYSSPLYKVTVFGRTIVEALEHSASVYYEKDCAVPEKNIYGAFIHVSGMEVTYNMTNPVKSRVKSVKVRCSECKVPSYEPIDLDKQYTLILSKYIAYGGDEFKMIKNGIIKMEDLNVTERESLIAYIKKMSPIYPEVDGRIKILN